MCDEIISNDINIYEEENYGRKNIWALSRYLKDHSELQSITDYLDGILNEKTVFRFLGDIITESVGGAHTYYISKQTYVALLGDKDIGDLVNAAEVSTESQAFVKEVYLSYINGTEDEFGEKGLSRSQPIRYEL